MKSYIFRSILKDEFNAFLDLRHSQGLKNQNRYIWEYMDRYLADSHVSEKAMTLERVEDWISSDCSGLKDKSIDCFITAYNVFAKYLISVGIPACIYPHALSMRRSKYIPYVFTNDEMTTIFSIADSGGSSKDRLSKIQFPVLLRILYGCGLRLGEALTLQIRDVDFDVGILLIRNGKGNKDRLVAMDASLTEVLKLYQASVLSGKPKEAYLFESNYKDGRRNCVGHHRSPGWARHNFSRIMEQAGISTITERNERGICPHCLRHTFVDHSLARQSENGVSSYCALPLISIYLGHEDLTETQDYAHLTASECTAILKRTSEKYGGMFPEVPK